MSMCTVFVTWHDTQTGEISLLVVSACTIFLLGAH